MMLLLLVLIARCSGSDEIPLDRAEQSSTKYAYGLIAAKAIDRNLDTYSWTTGEDPAWLRVYFSSSSTVKKVMVERAYSLDTACVWTVSVYDGKIETVCGNYTGKKG